MPDQTITEFTQAKHNRNAISINAVDTDDIDESWALKLLNECESEDTIISLGQEGREAAPQFLQHPQEVTDTDEVDMSSQRLLSAIECQKLAYEEKQQAKLEAELAGKSKLASSFSRLKAFFAA